MTYDDIKSKKIHCLTLSPEETFLENPQRAQIEPPPPAVYGLVKVSKVLGSRPATLLKRESKTGAFL